MTQPKCPFCLSIHDFSKDRHCTKHLDQPDMEVPDYYIDEYNRKPPLWLMTVGFSSHGKSCYLAALTMVLENLGKAIPGATMLPLDQYTRQAIRDVRTQSMVTGKLPGHTLGDLPSRPMLIHADDMPEIGSKTLVIYDTPGEMFESVQYSPESDYLQHLNQVRNIWFLISLKDLDEKKDKRIDELLGFYLNGMHRLKVPVAKRNLIVVYTKADLLIGQPNLNVPPMIANYVQEDPYQSLTSSNLDTATFKEFSYHDYIARMKEVSDVLEDFTRKNVPGGPSFIDLARSNKLNLHFCMISALGTSGHDGEIQAEPSRYRVLDPYLWALELSTEETDKPGSIRMIVDASNTSQKIYDHPMQDFHQKLCDSGEVTIFNLGQTRPVSRINQAPPSSPPKVKRPRLIGSILDQIGSNTTILLFSTGLVNDLDDFTRTWGERLFYVHVGEEEHQNWPNSIILRDGDSMDLVLDEFHRFLAEKQIH